MWTSRLTFLVLSFFHEIGHICRTLSCKWVNWNFHTQWRALYALLIGSYRHTALKGLRLHAYLGFGYFFPSFNSCTFGGQTCNITRDFQKIYTGIGVCYILNNSLSSIEPGERSGLSLVLNVEQYEYMRGPQNDAGVKVRWAFVMFAVWSNSLAFVRPSFDKVFLTTVLKPNVFYTIGPNL